MQNAEAGYSSAPKALPFMRQLGRHELGRSASTMTVATKVAECMRVNAMYSKEAQYYVHVLHAYLQCTGIHITRLGYSRDQVPNRRR